MATVITEAELLEALAATSIAPEDARTVREIVAATGVHEKRVKAALAKLNDAGRLLTHRVVRSRIDGVRSLTPAYTILPSPAAKHQP